MVYLLAKKGKPFTNDKVVKLCLIAAAEEVCPDKMNFLRLSLPAGKLLEKLRKQHNSL